MIGDNDGDDHDGVDDETSDPGLDSGEIAELREKAKERERQESGLRKEILSSPLTSVVGSINVNAGIKRSRKSQRKQSQPRATTKQKAVPMDLEDESAIICQTDPNEALHTTFGEKGKSIVRVGSTKKKDTVQVSLVQSQDKHKEKNGLPAQKDSVASLAAPPPANSSPPPGRNLPMPGAYAFNGSSARPAVGVPDASLLERARREATIMPSDSLVEASVVNSAENLIVAEEVRKDYHRHIMLIIVGFFTLAIAIVVAVLISSRNCVVGPSSMEFAIRFRK